MQTQLWWSSNRLQFVWDSPVIAGAMFGAVLPWLLAVAARMRHRALWFYGFGFASCTVGAAASLTQSRGPLLGIFVAFAVGAWAVRSTLGDRRFCVLIAAVAVCTIGAAALAGVGNRVVRAYERGDGSTENRIELWKAAAVTIGLHPQRGIGSGRAGDFASQWFESERLNYRYRTVLNEYLELGVEYGVLPMVMFLSLALICVIFPMKCGMFQGQDLFGSWIFSLGLGAYLSLVVIMVSAGFASIRYDGCIKIVIVLSIAMLVSAIVFGAKPENRARGLQATASIALVMASTIVAGAFLYGILHDDRPFEVRQLANGAVLLARRPIPSRELRSAVLFVDRSVMGPLYGKTVRKWFLGSKKFDQLIVPDPRAEVSSHWMNTTTSVVFVGHAVRLSDAIDLSQVGEIVLIHPIGPLPDGLHAYRRLIVYLPQVSEFGDNWRQWAVASDKVECRDSGSLNDCLEGAPLDL